MRRRFFHKLGLLLPAVTWLFIQFTMSGIMLGSSANATQIEICSPFGIQKIMIDLETGEPIAPLAGETGCDWCQSFSQITDTDLGGDVDWAILAQSFQCQLVASPPPHTPLRLAAGFQSRAPPYL